MVRFHRALAGFLSVCVVLTGSIVALAGPAPFVDRIDSPLLSITFLDVGQGDGILVQTADGKAVLIDAGPPEARGRVLARLDQLGVKGLDALVMTHAHADHVGGVRAVLEKLPVRLVLDPGFAHTTQMYADILEIVEQKGIKYRQPRAGFKVKIGQHAMLVFVAPADPLLSGTRSDANANSFVARLTVGEVDVMLTGDAEAETEARVLEVGGAALQSEVLKVAHHGSAYSTTEAFLAAVSPEVGVISVGASNRYGHPAPDTLRKLEKAGVTIFRTDVDGDVLLETDGRSYSVTRLGARAAAVSQGAEPAVAPAPTAAVAGGVDINSASVDQLTSLPGIGRTKAQAIVDYRTAHGPFTSAEGLGSVKGIGRKTVEKLAPLVSLGGGTAVVGAPRAVAPEAVIRSVAVGAGLDLNVASVTDLTSLPGIGRVRAEAIADFRAKSGGFSSVDQLRQVKGIGNKTLDKLRPLVRIGGGPAQEAAPALGGSPDQGPVPPRVATAASSGIDLNSATQEQLETLPGIGPAKAKAILERRAASGGFRSVDELRQVRGIGAKTLETLRPLVSVGSP